MGSWEASPGSMEHAQPSPVSGNRFVHGGSSFAKVVGGGGASDGEGELRGRDGGAIDSGEIGEVRGRKMKISMFLGVEPIYWEEVENNLQLIKAWVDLCKHKKGRWTRRWEEHGSVIEVTFAGSREETTVSGEIVDDDEMRGDNSLSSGKELAVGDAEMISRACGLQPGEDEGDVGSIISSHEVGRVKLGPGQKVNFVGSVEDLNVGSFSNSNFILIG